MYTNLKLLAVSVIITFTVLEVGVRVYDSFEGYGFFSNHRNVVNQPLNIYPFRMFGFDLYRYSNDELKISSRYGELYSLVKPDSVYRIVVFGGSTSENKFAYVNKGMHYPVLLETDLNSIISKKRIEVINVANSAYSTVHSLIIFELHVLSWEPDLIIVSHNINDLTASYWDGFRFDYSNKYSNEYYLPNMRVAFSTKDFLLQHFQIYWIIKNRFLQIFPKKFQIQRKSYGDQIDLMSRTIFKRNLSTIIGIAKNNNIDVLLATQPIYPEESFFNIHMEYKPYNNKVIYPIHLEFLNHHSDFNEVIRTVAGEFNVYFLDLAREFPIAKENFIDFVHYSPNGVKILSRLYSNYIKNSLHLL